MKKTLKDWIELMNISWIESKGMRWLAIVGNKLENVKISFDGNVVMQLDSVTADVSWTCDKKCDIPDFNYSKSISLTLKDVEVSRATVIEEIFYMMEVLKYVKHSKKREQAIKKYRKLAKTIINA